MWSATTYRPWATVTAVDPVNDQGDENRRVVRGGAWVNLPERLRAAFRSGYHVVDRFDDIGFRVAAAPAHRFDP